MKVILDHLRSIEVKYYRSRFYNKNKKIAKPDFGRETLNVQLQQTKALVRRRTEVLVHGSTVDGEKEEEKFKPRFENNF